MNKTELFFLDENVRFDYSDDLCVDLSLKGIRLDADGGGYASASAFRKEILKRLEKSGVLELLNPRSLTIDMTSQERGDLMSRVMVLVGETK